jgi:hypothetical protein
MAAPAAPPPYALADIPDPEVIFPTNMDLNYGENDMVLKPTHWSRLLHDPSLFRRSILMYMDGPHGFTIAPNYIIMAYKTLLEEMRVDDWVNDTTQITTITQFIALRPINPGAENGICGWRPQPHTANPDLLQIGNVYYIWKNEAQNKTRYQLQLFIPRYAMRMRLTTIESLMSIKNPNIDAPPNNTNYQGIATGPINVVHQYIQPP